MGSDLVMEVSYRRTTTIAEIVSGPLGFATVRTGTTWFILGRALGIGFLGGMMKRLEARD